MERMNGIKKSCLVASLGLAVASLQAVEIDSTWQVAYPDSGEDVICTSLKEAAAEISRDIAEASGFKLAVVPASKAKSPAIRLGESAAASAGLMPADLRAFQNVVAEKGGDIYLFGRDAASRKGIRKGGWMLCAVPSARAAARFLRDRAGVRFLMPGATGTEVTHKGPVTLPDGAFDRENPRLEYGAGRYHGMMYDMANNIFGLGVEYTYGGHSYEHACPAKKYAKDHPEYFGILDGKRAATGGQVPLCVSNPEVQQLMVDELCRRFDEGADSCQLGQQDGFRGCECDKCAAIGGGGLSWGERLWIVHRDIAERLARLRPGKTVHIMSYGPTIDPPRTFKVFPENVMIEMCKYTEKAFEDWKGYKVPRGFSVYTYLWGNYPRPGFTPKHSFAVVAAMARRFLSNGVRGIYRCGYGELFGLEGPAYYVFNMLLENPDADVSALVSEYCQAAFGAAAPQMLAFYDYLSLQLHNGWSLLAGPGMGEYRSTYRGSSLPALGYVYSPDAVKAMEKSLRNAETTPGLSEKVKRRLALVRLEWDYARNLGKIATLYAAYKTAPTKDLFASLADALRERKAFIDRLYEKDSSRPRKIDGWPELMPFGGFDRKLFAANGRLSAKLGAPLNWDVDRMQAAGVLPGASAKSMAAVRASERPSSTDFESGAWAAAAWHDLVGSELQKLENSAHVKVLYDDEALHIVIESDLEAAKKVSNFGHDGPVWRDESAEVMVDPTGSRERFYHFASGPEEGSVYDEANGLIDDPLHPKFRQSDAGWNAGGTAVANRRVGDRWAAYFRIPYTDIGAGKPAAGDEWCVNFCRTWFYVDKAVRIDRARKAVSAYWNPNLEGGSFSSPEAMGVMKFE